MAIYRNQHITLQLVCRVVLFVYNAKCFIIQHYLIPVPGAFSVAVPVVWNSLPAAVREADSMHSFRRKLKTHLFTLSFID